MRLSIERAAARAIRRDVRSIAEGFKESRRGKSRTPKTTRSPRGRLDSDAATKSRLPRRMARPRYTPPVRVSAGAAVKTETADTRPGL